MEKYRLADKTIVTQQLFMYEKLGAASQDLCVNVISAFEECIAVNSQINSKNHHYLAFGGEQFGTKSKRNDVQLWMPYFGGELFPHIMNVAYDALDEYKSEIWSLSNIGSLVSHCAKIQRTPIGGGFSEWHSEHMGGTASNRVLAWMIYLNDVESGGDTEFCYQRIKVKPEAGKIVIWPAGFTHPHRGNPPYSNEKYIATGWFEVAPADVYCEGLSALSEKQRRER